jgi:gamma-glutamyl-gamma-aminobutyrate hydrolase PuuD
MHSPPARRPLIGLTAYREHASWGVWHTQAALLPHNYVDLLTQAGGVPVLLPLSEDDAAASIVAALDGLVLTGGPDIEPVRYGAAPDPYAERFQSDRDTWESALLAEALRVDLPVFGICRGMQLINVHCGGTLVQHLPEHLGHQEHRRVLGSFDGADHDVALKSGSLAAQAAGEVDHATKSHHHQGIDRLGDGLLVSGESTLDDLPEALELPGRRFVLGVQWHPEADTASKVIRAFVEAARGLTPAEPARSGEHDGERRPRPQTAPAP